MAPRLYILCGLPFAGKTALASELAPRLGVVHLELDQINTERGLGLDGEPIAAADWSVTYREAYARLGRYLQDGRSVLFDATNYSRAQRDVLRWLAANAGAEAVVIYVNTPGAEARRRWLANRVSGQRPDVRDEDFRKVVEHFESPRGEENVVEYDGALPPDEWLPRLRR